MNLFDVYPLFDITPVKAGGCYIWDAGGDRYLDLYGGHAVISIGHGHPHYVDALKRQLDAIAFYSNSVQMPLQNRLADLLGKACGYPDYNLFLCNSGAEANENAFKAASFHTGRKVIVSCRKAFHGRTSAAVAATDDPAIIAPVNRTDNVVFIHLNDANALETALRAHPVAAVIVEGVQGIGGVHVPDAVFLQRAQALCRSHGAMLILDEIQSGYGRTGKFFAHQYAHVQPDIITVAKGMGNGFPVGGVLIQPGIQARHGMLGTTFGGNYLACAAAIAVLEVIEAEGLIANALAVGSYLKHQLHGLPGVRDVRGYGLMLGLELDVPCHPVRTELLKQYKIFTGSSSDKNTLRLLPALTLTKDMADVFLQAFTSVMSRLAEQRAAAAL